MKRIVLGLLTLCASTAFGATLVPIQLLNPTGSTAGQMLVSAGASSAPTWSNAPTITGGTINGAAIGGTTPAAGKFTTLQATSTITPSTTAGIAGTTAADNANAGSVGVTQIASNTSGSALSNSTSLNVTSLSLPAGDWDVSGNFEATFTGNNSGGFAWLTTTSLANPGIGQRFALSYTATANTADIGGVVPTIRVNVSTTTTVYLVGFVGFTSGASTGYGQIIARVRR